MSHKSLHICTYNQETTQETSGFLSIKCLEVQKYKLGNFFDDHKFPSKSRAKVAFFFEICKNNGGFLRK